MPPPVPLARELQRPDQAPFRGRWYRQAGDPLFYSKAKEPLVNTHGWAEFDPQVADRKVAGGGLKPTLPEHHRTEGIASNSWPELACRVGFSPPGTTTSAAQSQR